MHKNGGISPNLAEVIRLVNDEIPNPQEISDNLSSYENDIVKVKGIPKSVCNVWLMDNMKGER